MIYFSISLPKSKGRQRGGNEGCGLGLEGAATSQPACLQYPTPAQCPRPVLEETPSGRREVHLIQPSQSNKV